MDEQTYYNDSLAGLEAIAQYSEAAAEAAERTADATEFMGSSVADLIKQYQKEANRKSSKKSGSGASDIGGSVSDILNQVHDFDDTAKEKGNDVIDFFSRFHSDVISKYTTGSLDGFTDTIDSITNILSRLTSSIDLTGITPANAEAMKLIIESMSSNILVLGQSLARSAIFYKTAEPAIPIIGRVITNLLSTIYENLGDKEDVERAKIAAETIYILSGSVFKLSKALALSTPFMILAIPGAAAFSAIMSIMSPALSKLAVQAPMIKEGSKAMRHMSISMIAFSGSMAISALVLKNLEKEDIPKFIALYGAMGVSALVYQQIGRHGTSIVKGSIGVLAMSASTLIFTKTTEMAVESVPDPMKLGLLALEMGGMALVYGLIGKFSGNILMGSLAVAAMGLSLMLLANPLDTISDVLDDNGDILWKLPVLLTGLGAVYALAGTPPIPLLIMAGAAAFATIGGSLMVISAGLKKMSEINMTQEDSMNMRYAIEGVVRGFSESFRGMTVKEAVTLPLKITAVAGMGGALALLGIGLGKYKDAASGWDEEDTDQLNYMITSLSESFALAGSPDGMSKIFGFKVGKSDTERGIDSTMRMGKNLRRLSQGIKEWKEMDLSEQDMQIISDNVTRVLTTIPNIFAGIGKSQREDSTNQLDFLGMSFSIPFTKTDVELGIESTMKMGDNLKTLSDGVMAWKDFDASSLVQIQDNILSVLGAIPSAFAEIGKEERETSKGILWWKKGDVERGAQVFDTVGPTLRSVADLVMGFKDIPDVASHAENMGKGVSTILQHLATGVGYFDDGKIKLLEDLPEPLSQLTKVFLEWKDIFKDFMQMDFAKVEEAAVLALKLDRIQRGLRYEEAETETDDGLTTQGIKTSSTGEANAANAAVAPTIAAAESEMMKQLLIVLSELQQGVTLNTAAVVEVKEHLMAGTIKTKNVGDDVF